MPQRITSSMLVLCLSLAVLLSLPLNAGAQTKFKTIDVPGSTETDANGINTAGTIVGFYIDSAGATHGFSSAAGKFKSINIPNSSSTLVYGINDANAMVGWFSDATTGITHGFMFAAGKATKIDPPGSTFTNAWSINSAGVIVGTYIGSDSVFHGFVDTAGTYTSFDAPGATLTEILGINNKNQMVGIYLDSAAVQHGFTLVGTKFTSFDYPMTGVNVTAADRINDSGEIVGLYGTNGSAGPFMGYTRLGKTFTSVLFPNSTETRVRGVNNGGMIVGRYTDTSGHIHGMEAQ